MAHGLGDPWDIHGEIMRRLVDALGCLTEEEMNYARWNESYSFE
jgi:phage gp16-like protein